MIRAFLISTLTALVSLSINCAAVAEQLSFPSVWSQISADSSAQKSAQLQVQAATAAKDRARRHWLPRIYLDATSYETNDPGTSFFGLLEQRSLSQHDFDPDRINRPDRHLYTRGALGIDLALYEGGMKAAQVEIQKHSLTAQENANSQTRLEEYSQAGVSFASIAILSKQKEKLAELGETVENLLRRYQIGQKSNPVGYSGLLGMKSLANRLAGLLNRHNAETRAYYQTLREMGLTSEDWSPRFKSAILFAETYLTPGETGTQSYQQVFFEEDSKAKEEAGKTERAKYLPRVGAFAESHAFNGTRDTATGYVAGLYLKWNLFDPSDFGSFKEAKLKAAAAARSSDAYARQERAHRARLLESFTSLKENIALLDESDKILLEQIKVTATLFKNGSISALQFVEVLNRRADLITEQSEAELALVKVASEAITHEKFDIMKHIHETKD